ncbi:N-acetylglucosamine kinase [Microvirga puerhi]|uniref:ATPase BadF/BadG/BcrA/BcrD type domain-containing protein n=1 Tax=Microvirga puerhi TaxID=2876078 RepID=A0ABS7VUA5_9HYPH|nr:BadF/BadG/BcrA/BcrD ATPase family protein [Microvirga puerhi]MBZ6079154.1 hypothetical protein [Microvirga puerhi]
MTTNDDMHVGIDVGQGGTRLMVRCGSRVERFEAAGFWSAGLPGVVTAVANGIKAASIPADAHVHIGIGMTGLNGNPVPIQELSTALSGTCCPVSVTAADDSVTAYLGALGPRAGAVVAAGTGTVALATDMESRWGRADGWGGELGDHGSGYWIGREGIRRALRGRDAGIRGRLLDAVERRFGPADRLPELWRSGAVTPDRVAALAYDIAEIARQGDEVARAIWAEAGIHLAQTVSFALRKSGMDRQDVPVAATGGLFAALDLIGSTFEETLRQMNPQAFMVSAIADPLMGALELIMLPNTAAFGSLVERDVATGSVEPDRASAMRGTV